MNLIRYVIDFFHINGAGQQSVKYAKGQTYPESDETISHVEAGHAEIVVVEVSATTETTDADAAPQPDNNVEQGSPVPVADAPVQNEAAPVTGAATDTPAVADATAAPDTTDATEATATVSQPQPDLTQTPAATDPAPVAAASADTTVTDPTAQAAEPVPPVTATPVDQPAQVASPAEAAPTVDATPTATVAAPDQAGQN
ncbi:hypothetical protein [Undibacterium sp. RuRC25W]|uniref:hypothetical protein n=1 Tax=Undibacterium sp. RuRC25W TaxID=3413047 RepID=UPI003BF079AA